MISYSRIATCLASRMSASPLGIPSDATSESGSIDVVRETIAASVSVIPY